MRDIEDIRGIIERVNEDFLGLKINFHSPIVKISVNERNRDKGFYERWWPDSEVIENSIIVEDFIVPMKHNPIWPLDCTSVEFLYRLSNPAMCVCWYELRRAQRGDGKSGDMLFDLMHVLGERLGCEERIYLSNVTNPGYWSSKGYGFLKKHGAKKYWARV